MQPKNESIAEFDSVVASFKGKRNKNDYDEAEADEMIIAVAREMKDAAVKDLEANNSQQPAMSKLKVLPKVTDLLKKSYLYEQMLENDILEPIKLWLEPLPDGSLPSINIRKLMFEVLPKMPISIEQLRDSRLGRVVMFYSKCEQETNDIRRKAGELINLWSQPLLQHVRRMKAAEARIDEQDLSTPAPNVTSSVHARIPQPMRTTYSVQPRSNAVINESKGKVDSKFLIILAREQVQKVRTKIQAQLATAFS